MSVIRVCCFWCCRLFYCILDLLLKSLNKPLDPLVCCYSVVIFSQVEVATKLWNVAMLVFFQSVRGLWMHHICRRASCSDLCLWRVNLLRQENWSQTLGKGPACCRNARLEFS